MPSPERAVALVGASQPVVLLAASGTVDECQQWIDSARGMARRWPCDWPPLRLALPGGIAVPDDLAELTIRHFPLMECLPGVRLLVGSAGYNLVHETHATATAALFFAQARLYDDQARRVACADRSVPLLEQIRRKLDEPPPQAVAVINGATLAAHQLARLLGELRPAAP